MRSTSGIALRRFVAEFEHHGLINAVATQRHRPEVDVLSGVGVVLVVLSDRAQSCPQRFKRRES
jgi:hypothetical protein